jgi:hypothetical protein
MDLLPYRFRPEFVSRETALLSVCTLTTLVLGTVLWDLSRRAPPLIRKRFRWPAFGCFIITAVVALATIRSAFFDTPEGKNYALQGFVKDGRIDAAIQFAIDRRCLPALSALVGKSDKVRLFRIAPDAQVRMDVLPYLAREDAALGLQVVNETSGNERLLLLQTLFTNWGPRAGYRNLPADPKFYDDVAAAYAEANGAQMDIAAIAQLAATGSLRDKVQPNPALAASLLPKCELWTQCHLHRLLASREGDPALARAEWNHAIRCADEAPIRKPNERLGGIDVSNKICYAGMILRDLPATGFDKERLKAAELLAEESCLACPIGDEFWMRRLEDEVFVRRKYLGQRKEANDLLRRAWKLLLSLPPSQRRSDLIDGWAASWKSSLSYAVDGGEQPLGPVPRLDPPPTPVVLPRPVEGASGPSPVFNAMTALASGRDSLIPSVKREFERDEPDWEKLGRQTAEVVRVVAIVAKSTQPKGSRESWVKHTGTLTASAAELSRAVQKRDKPAGLAVYKAMKTQCAVCHKEHYLVRERGKPFPELE